MSWADGIKYAAAIIGWGVAFWKWHQEKAKKGKLADFLLGLKSAQLPANAVNQINDMIAQLKR